VRTSAYLLIWLALAVWSCGGEVSINHYRSVDSLLEAGRPDDAAGTVRDAGRQVYGARNRLLYHLDLGMALHLMGDYQGSIGQFEQAHNLGNDLYTRSLTGEAGSLFASDLLVPYAGEEFELVLINVFNALNYVFLKRIDDALVEVRRTQVKLDDFAARAPGRYRVDPLALYLGGMLYEQAGMVDDALISCRAALQAYGASEARFQVVTPRALAGDVVRLSGVVGVEVDEDTLALAGPLTGGTSGEVVLLHYFGPGPRKREKLVEVSLGNGLVHAYAIDVRSDEQKRVQRAFSVAKGMASTTQVTVAYPVFEQPHLAATRAVVEVQGCASEGSVVVANLSRIAGLNLEDRMSREWPRYVGRAVLKFLSARAVGMVGEEVSGNKGVGLIFQLLTQSAMSAAEAADTRGWRVLPALVHMTRVVCPEGTYAVQVSHLGASRGRTLRFEDVRVDDGKKTFLVTSEF